MPDGEFVENDEYYMYQCKLHIPWRGKSESILPEDSSWHEFYLDNLQQIEHSDIINELPPPDGLEFEDEEFNDPHVVVRDPATALAR